MGTFFFVVGIWFTVSVALTAFCIFIGWAGRRLMKYVHKNATRSETVCETRAQ